LPGSLFLGCLPLQRPDGLGVRVPLLLGVGQLLLGGPKLLTPPLGLFVGGLVLLSLGLVLDGLFLGLCALLRVWRGFWLVLCLSDGLSPLCVVVVLRCPSVS
jgi:hypothetical protein